MRSWLSERVGSPVIVWREFTSHGIMIVFLIEPDWSL